MTTDSETTTNWWQGILGGNETTTAETPTVTEPEVTDAPAVEIPTDIVTDYSEE